MLILFYSVNHSHEKLYRLHSGSRHLSTNLVKDFHLFKIAESVFNFYLKLHNF